MSRQFGLADQHAVSASEARAVDEIYRLLIGAQSEISARSGSMILPSGNVVMPGSERASIGDALLTASR